MAETKMGNSGVDMPEVYIESGKKGCDVKDIGKARKLLSILINNMPSIKIIDEVDESGDVRFEVAMDDVGLKIDVVDRYSKEIFSPFTVNVLGEMLVRENISAFAEIINRIDQSRYLSIVNRFEHKRFGMTLYKNKILFCFHISLIQSILMEDLKKGLMNV